MKNILFIIIAICTVAGASNQTLVQSKEIDVDWKAYKTLGKVGVGGKFTSISYTPASLRGKNLNDLLVGSKVLIDSNKLNTGNPARDKTVAEYFFGKMATDKIEAVIKEVKEDGDGLKSGMVLVMITMNNKSLNIPMSYSYDSDEFRAKGVIDLADFEALLALASINKSCYDLHSGKTWQDVAIGFSIKIKTIPGDLKIEK